MITGRGVMAALLGCGLLGLESALFASFHAARIEGPPALGAHLALVLVTALPGFGAGGRAKRLQLAAWVALLGPFGVLIGMTLFLPALFGVGLSTNLGLAVAFLVLYGVGWGFFDCNNMPILSQIVRPQVRATGYGVMNMVSISCGGFADWGFGALRDRHVPLYAIFGVFAGLALVSVFIVLGIRPRPSPAAEESPA